MDHADSPQAIAPSRWSFGDLTSRSWFWPVFALALIFMVDGVVSPGFFSIRIVQGRLFGSLIDVLYRGAPTALVALGMAVVIGTKGIDLSVGAVVAIAGAVMTNLIHRDMSPPLVLALTLGAGMLCGLWNGFLVAILDIQPIIATLILMVAGRGIALLIDEGLIVTFRSDFFSAISTGEFLTVPSRIIVCAGTLLFLWLILRRTALGLFIESVGGNSAAADLAGINARLVKIGAYTLSGLCSGLAGVLICADIRGSDSNNAGLFIELDAILAVVIGGGSLAGGRFYLGLTIVGVLIIQGLTTSILVSGLPAQFNMIVKGVVVLIVLLLGSRRLRESIVGLFRRRTA
jgi:galactofuranose transport system permease protein